MKLINQFLCSVSGSHN